MTKEGGVVCQRVITGLGRALKAGPEMLEGRHSGNYVGPPFEGIIIAERAFETPKGAEFVGKFADFLGAVEALPAKEVLEKKIDELQHDA